MTAGKDTALLASPASHAAMGGDQTVGSYGMKRIMEHHIGT
jgi:hypothetical protein